MKFLRRSFYNFLKGIVKMCLVVKLIDQSEPGQGGAVQIWISNPINSLA